ncbi:MAG: septum formation initiator family protein [Beijerinckiaceae bacterium]|jgi:cell division protein FtsB|nr:septum formation initiator family protein [Beijerinckiaceae bacterium]
MIIRTRRRRIGFLLAFHAIAWSASAYFAHSAYTGDRGLLAKQQAKEMTSEVVRKIGEAKAERQAWERRVSQLSGKEIDRDLLDERQRLMLNSAHRNDVIILLNP